MKETEREIKTETTYFSQSGVLYKKVVKYSVLSNAKIQGEPDEPSLSEFRDLVVGKDTDKKPDGQVVADKSSTVY